MPKFRRPHHQAIAKLLAALDPSFLQEAECYFAGGTRIALELAEYRESRDVDFLCASRAGFRKLRETVTQESLGAIARRPLSLAREVRADRDGIRTFAVVDDCKIKFEVVLEARIELAGSRDATFGVPTLDMQHTIAEKFLANTDRGLDASTLFRDLADLAFLAADQGKKQMVAGLELAEAAYGKAVCRHLGLVLDKYTAERVRAAAAIKTLGITDGVTLKKGMQILRTVK